MSDDSNPIWVFIGGAVFVIVVIAAIAAILWYFHFFPRLG